MIDWTRVGELKRDLGEDDFDEVILLFLQEVEERLDVLGKEGTENIGEDLHFLKGSAANLGFRKLRDICRRFEDGDTIDNIDDILVTYAQSKDEFMQVYNLTNQLV